MATRVNGRGGEGARWSPPPSARGTPRLSLSRPPAPSSTAEKSHFTLTQPQETCQGQKCPLQSNRRPPAPAQRGPGRRGPRAGRGELFTPSTFSSAQRRQPGGDPPQRWGWCPCPPRGRSPGPWAPGMPFDGLPHRQVLNPTWVGGAVSSVFPPPRTARRAGGSSRERGRRSPRLPRRPLVWLRLGHQQACAQVPSWPLLTLE